MSMIGHARGAFGASIKFCFTVIGEFEDNGFELSDNTTEDFWITDVPHRLRGTRAVVKIGVTTYFDGNLGIGLGMEDPGAGCTTTMTVPSANATYDFQLYSSGAVIPNSLSDEHELNTQDDDSDDTVHDINLITVWPHAGGEGTFNVELLDGDAEVDWLWRLHATAAYVLTRVGRWTEASTVDVFLDMDDDARNHYDDGDVFINAQNDNLTIGRARKYAIAHEMGHVLANVNAGATGGDCDLEDTECPSVGSHGMSSKEYQTCAFTEGLAHFFSAATWNDFNEADCVFRYWGNSTIDCEGSLTSGSWPEAYMETNCSTSSNTDRGVELDWLRQMWDVKTDGSNVSFSTMEGWLNVAWFYASLPPNWDDPYVQLEASSDFYGGTVDSNWDGAQGTNGIDW